MAVILTSKISNAITTMKKQKRHSVRLWFRQKQMIKKNLPKNIQHKLDLGLFEAFEPKEFKWLIRQFKVRVR
jgi:hypothetical protein